MLIAWPSRRVVVVPSGPRLTIAGKSPRAWAFRQTAQPTASRGTLPPSGEPRLPVLAAFTGRVFTLLTLVLLAAPVAIEAQPAGKIHRTAYLGAHPPHPAFLQGLRGRGWIEDQNIVIVSPYSRIHSATKSSQEPAGRACPATRYAVSKLAVPGGREPGRS
jgi:hypothetical protein